MLPRVSTFFSMTEELHALSIISLVVDIQSKSVVDVLIFGAGWTGFMVDRLKDIAELVRLMMFRDTMALCRMFPVGNDLDVTLTYCGVPMMVAFVVRAPKPMIVLAVPCDITVLNAPVLLLRGILKQTPILVGMHSQYIGILLLRPLLRF